MQTMTGQEIAANFMVAAANLLVGAADRHDELNDSVAIMFGGSAQAASASAKAAAPMMGRPGCRSSPVAQASYRQDGAALRSRWG